MLTSCEMICQAEFENPRSNQIVPASSLKGNMQLINA